MTELERHLGLGKQLEIDGEKYNIKPLTISELPKLFKLASYLDGLDEKSITSLPPEAMEILVDLIKITLQRSFPNEKEETLDEFGMKYMNEIFPLIIDINGSADRKAITRKDQKIMNGLNKNVGKSSK